MEPSGTPNVQTQAPFLATTCRASPGPPPKALGGLAAAGACRGLLPRLTDLQLLDLRLLLDRLLAARQRRGDRLQTHVFARHESQLPDLRGSPRLPVSFKFLGHGELERELTGAPRAGARFERSNRGDILPAHRVAPAPLSPSRGSRAGRSTDHRATPSRRSPRFFLRSKGGGAVWGFRGLAKGCCPRTASPSRQRSQVDHREASGKARVAGPPRRQAGTRSVRADGGILDSSSKDGWSTDPRR